MVGTPPVFTRDLSRFTRPAGLAASLLLAVAAVASEAPDAEPVVFGRDIRPVLSDRCFQCHGFDAAQRKARLRLDDAASATRDRGGYAAIVPGDAAASELWQRIASDDPDLVMPPPEAGKNPLTPEEKDAIRRWLDDGARYETHWSFTAPSRPELPDASAVPDRAWRVHPVDRFVARRLDRAGLEPSPPADAATLLRRVFLDLTGLPPTPDELDAFIAECGEDESELDAAYARWVDRLLTEEPYLTRMAENLTVPWLDAARYADTCGIHQDNGRQMWLWRNWVIDAIRANMPYDRFVTEQIAGDLMPDATLEQIIASGFNRNHVTTDEGGAIPEEYLLEYAVDRVNTASTVFLGLTMGCVRCHDHKYDPITMEDYYGLIAFFNSNDEPGLYSQTQDVNRAYEPFITVPTDEQSARRAELSAELDAVVASLEQPLPGEEDERTAFVEDAMRRAGVAWVTPEVIAAASSDDAVTLTVEDDAVIAASGPMPAQEDYVLELRTEATGLRLLLLEALSMPGADQPGAGRASHGNAVISHLVLESSIDNGASWSPVPLDWAWANHAQANGDFHATNVLDPDELGWALDSYESPGPRLLAVRSATPFGATLHAPEARLRVTVAFRSPYPQHSIGRLRLRASPLDEQGAAMLPAAASHWYAAGPFRAEKGDDFSTDFGPEQGDAFDRGATFEPGMIGWRFSQELVDGTVVQLGGNLGAQYLGRTVFAPTARTLEVSLGSDDGFRLFVNGAEVAANRTSRPAAADQDRATIELRAGANAIVYKIVNTGGPSAYYFRSDPGAEVLEGKLAQALLPGAAQTSAQQAEFRAAYRRSVLPAYRETEAERDRLQAAIAELDTTVARTMIMREKPEPRPTFVMMRGQYDQPDPQRPVQRSVPAVLGTLADDAPRNRLGLAQWLTDDANPLVARVAVNRFWAQCFGAGLVETAEDFGLQGSWPSHPELLDWLAVDFVEQGWDVHRLLRLIVLSRTYRQRSDFRPDAALVDSSNALLWRYGARRLSAEQIRDLALYASGLLVEDAGGASVRPYQPEGLWREIAMLNSNTRFFRRDDGDALWRRSMYTYWKRACPPPSLMTFDAPTRESCVIRRGVTNTPLQALVLWNDVQYVEAARLLAQRTLLEDTDAGDDARAGGRDERLLTRLFRRCTGRQPDGGDLEQLRAALEDFRARYRAEPSDADALLGVGEMPTAEGIDRPDLAAWTMLANAVLSLHETITQD